MSVRNGCSEGLSSTMNCLVCKKPFIKDLGWRLLEVLVVESVVSMFPYVLYMCKGEDKVKLDRGCHEALFLCPIRVGLWMSVFSCSIDQYVFDR